MSRKFSKITAALVATLTISAAAASFTTDTASARMMGGERMGRMGHMNNSGHMGRMGHMGHGYRHGGHGFGRGAALGFAGGIVAAAIIAAANQPYIESVDTQTGERVRSEGQPGRHVVTRTNRNGKKNQKVNKPEPDSASVVEGNRTATSTSNGNGTRTVTSNTAPPQVNGGEPASMSWTDPATGVTTTLTSDGNGGHTTVQTNAAGDVLP